MPSIDPIAGNQKIAVQPRLFATGLWTPVVAPPDERRQRHENRLGASVRLQPEQRAAVIDQVELDVASSAVRLEIALALSVRQILAPQQNGFVGVEKTIAHAARQGEAVLE